MKSLWKCLISIYLNITSFKQYLSKKMWYVIKMLILFPLSITLEKTVIFYYNVNNVFIKHYVNKKRAYVIKILMLSLSIILVWKWDVIKMLI